MKENECVACHGEGMQADDEGWQYECSVCDGLGVVPINREHGTRIMSVDENNRLLD